MDNKEINRLVATKVMGYEWVENTDGLKGLIPHVWKTDNGYRSSFRPSQDIEHAWKVAEKFWRIEIEKEDNIYYTCIHTGTTDPECEDGSELIYFAEADSAPMAICKAALLSIGISI